MNIQMGSSGLHVGSPKLFPVKGSLASLETRGRTTNAFGEGANNEYGILADKNGTGIIGYMGDKHSVAVDDRVLNSDGIFTHRHPNKYFGGSFSVTDIKLFAQSNLSEIRAFSKQGQLYSLKAGANSNKTGLGNWAKGHQSLLQKNFEKSYSNALKSATTPLKSGAHKGMIKIAAGRANGKTTYKYVNPMSPAQAEKYARQYSVGSIDRAIRNAAKKYGFTYTSTKAGN